MWWQPWRILIQSSQHFGISLSRRCTFSIRTVDYQSWPCIDHSKVLKVRFAVHNDHKSLCVSPTGMGNPTERLTASIAARRPARPPTTTATMPTTVPVAGSISAVIDLVTWLFCICNTCINACTVAVQFWRYCDIKKKKTRLCSESVNLNQGVYRQPEMIWDSNSHIRINPDSVGYAIWGCFGLFLSTMHSFVEDILHDPLWGEEGCLTFLLQETGKGIGWVGRPPSVAAKRCWSALTKPTHAADTVESA